MERRTQVRMKLRYNQVINEFSDDLGILTLGQGTSTNGNLSSPSAVLNGDLQKKWIRKNGELLLLKAGTSAVQQEVYNEVVVTALHGLLLQDNEFVPYSLFEQGRAIFCACPNMLDDRLELIPAYDVVSNQKKCNSENDFQFLVRQYRKLGIEGGEQALCKMFTCDFLIANSDRHYRNFGIIRHAVTLEVDAVAPIFDSGMSLWCNKRGA